MSTDAERGMTDESGGERRLLVRVAGLFRGGMRELMVPTERRMPFLDLLRSIAVLLVVNGHMGGVFTRTYGATAYTRFILTRGGWMGVDLFFVLSGYFIGSQLWRELGRTGTISYKNFVIRRGLRIWPLYYFLFIVIFLFVPGLAARKEYGWTDLIFITNYLNHGIVLGSWSLASEEQFYLITPLALLLIGRRTMRKYRWGLGALFGLVLVVRTLTYMAYAGHFFGKHPAAFDKVYYPFHTHCDGLIAGLIVANLVVSKERVKGLLARPGLLVVLSFLLLCALMKVQGNIFEFSGLAIFFASVVWWGVSTETKWFSQHIFYLISRLSFGMYLNHEWFAPTLARRVLPALGLMHFGLIPAEAAGFVLLALTSMAVAAVTFCLIEHPFLMLRTALLRKATPHLTAH